MDQSRLVLCGESVKTGGTKSNELKASTKREYLVVQEEQEKTKTKEKLPVKQAHVATLQMTLKQSQPYGKESAHRKQINGAINGETLAVDFQPASIF